MISNPPENAGSPLLPCWMSHIYRMAAPVSYHLFFNLLEKGHTFVIQTVLWVKTLHCGQHTYINIYIYICMHYTFRRNLGHTGFMADLLLDYPLIQCIRKNIKNTVLSGILTTVSVLNYGNIWRANHLQWTQWSIQKYWIMWQDVGQGVWSAIYFVSGILPVSSSCNTVKSYCGCISNLVSKLRNFMVLLPKNILRSILLTV